MAIGQVFVTACRQSQRSVCYVKQFATMHVIRGLCYIMCYTWTLDIATLCVICGLCYIMCYTWTLNIHMFKYVDTICEI